MMIDAVVAGSGIWGCTVARRLAEAGRQVLVVEKRPVVGGNVRCEIDPETGIEIHTYGSHIFHTHIPEVWEFVNRFVAFNGYQHKVLASTRSLPRDADERLRAKVESGRGRTYHLPLGLTLINKFFDVELKPSELALFMADEKHSAAVFDAFFRGYTCKQWGKTPEEIDPSIIKRVPVRSNYDTNYFNDYNQGIPLDGYNSLFERLLDHPNITVRCRCALIVDAQGRLKVQGDGEGEINPLFLHADAPFPVYYSGPIDALFNYEFGQLPWRTLRFEMEKLDMADYQGAAVINYPDIDVPFTRIHEFKHYHPNRKHGSLGELDAAAGKTVIMREYSAQWKLGDEPYYPIDTTESRNLLSLYQAEAAKRTMGKIHLRVGGRLGGYKYYDMDRSIGAALSVDLN